MTVFLRLLALIGMLAVSACATGSGPVGTAASGWKLDDVSVRFGPDISRTAPGTEFNSNFVWNGYGEGNRKRQVVGMFRSAMDTIGETTLIGNRPVNMSVQINYFHALTDFSRLWCCGAHRIFADLKVEDAETGEVLAEGDNVPLGRVALGGIPGLIAVAAGRDQAVRIEEGIVKNTRRWLSQF